MRVVDLLRVLDDAVLPPLAVRLSRLGQGPRRKRTFIAIGLLSAAVLMVMAVWYVQRPPAVSPIVEGVARVGVSDGESIPGYVATTRAELDTPGPASYALVSFVAYLAPERSATLLEGASVFEVFSRVPLRDLRTQIVRIPATRLPGDVVEAMFLFAERKQQEAEEYEERAADAAEKADGSRLRPIYETAATVAYAEATAYRTRCSCVYAAVVRAAPADLRRLAARPGVRAVDPAPEVRRLDRAVFLPPLPEHGGRPLEEG